MLRWLAKRDYNRFDLIWFALMVLAWSDRGYLAATVAAIGGGFLSGILEALAKQATGPQPHQQGSKG